MGWDRWKAQREYCYIICLRYTAQVCAASDIPVTFISSPDKAVVRIRRYDRLVADDFRHPLDQQNTRLLRVLPGLEAIAKTLMGWWPSPMVACILTLFACTAIA